MAKNGILTAVIYIEDPVREEAEAVVNSLRKLGISKMVMMTGDSERTAKLLQKKLGLMSTMRRCFRRIKRLMLSRKKIKEGK